MEDSMGKVSIIIPAYNEEKNLPHLIINLRKLEEYDLEIIVVDDGSNDKTSKVAKKLGTKVISYRPNRGKGVAFRKAVSYVTRQYVIQIDADHQFQPFDIPCLIKSLKDGNDIVLGSRFKGGSIEKGAVSKLNWFGNYVISLLISVFSGQRVYDIMAGFKAFKKDALCALNLKVDHFGYEAEILIKGKSMGFKIDEVPITYTRRLDGETNVKKLKDGIMVLATILKTKLNILLKR